MGCQTRFSLFKGPSKPARRSRQVDLGTRFDIEHLEGRVLLSTINWVNRGTPTSDSDSFRAVFGSGAETARQVVDAVIRAWESAIESFNYSDPDLEDTFALTVSMGTGNLGGISAKTGGKPTAGWVTLDRGAGWFIDPTPYHHEEFLGTLVNPYVAYPTSGGPAEGLADFYSFVMAEMVHSLGLAADSDLLLQQDPGGYLTNTGQLDQSPTPPVGTLWTFNGPSVQALLTSNNAGTTDVGAPIHVAEAHTGNVITSGGVTYYGVEDPGLAGGNASWRIVVSNLITQVFKDAYGYTINPPTWNNLHTILDPATGVLHVRGGEPGDAVYPQQLDPSHDTIRVNGFTALGTDYVKVDVVIGNPVPGIGPNVTLSSTFFASEVSSIVIDSGDGDDSITIHKTYAGIPLTINGGDGDDEILIYAEDLDDFVTVDGGDDDDTLTFAGTTENDFFLLRRHVADVNVSHLFVNGWTRVDLRKVNRLVTVGGPLFGEGNDEFVVDFRDGNPLSAMELDFLGGLGDDVLTFRTGPFGGRLNARFVGERGTDRIEFMAAGGEDLSLTDDLLTRTDVAPGLQVTLDRVEEAVLIGGTADNRFDASGFSAGRVTLRGGAGNDHLIGGPNDDELDGGSGDDTMDGGGGDDTYIEMPGSDDLIIDPSGRDTIDFSMAERAITLDLFQQHGEVQTVDSAGNTLALTGNIERVIGSGFDDTFVGTFDITQRVEIELWGRGGNDRFLFSGSPLPGSWLRIFGEDGDDKFLLETPYGGQVLDPKLAMLTARFDGGEGKDSLQVLASSAAEAIDIRVVAGQDSKPYFDVAVRDVAGKSLQVQLSAEHAEGLSVDAADGDDDMTLQVGLTTPDDIVVDLGPGNDRLSALIESAGLIAVPLVANGGMGDDMMMFFTGQNNAAKSTAVAFLADGGPGKDFIQGSDANEIILGNDGDDVLMGGGGRDLMIGGSGVDALDGGAGEDILVVGLTSPDSLPVPHALQAILGYWSLPQLDFLTRVRHLSGLDEGPQSHGPFHLIFGETVHDDGVDNSFGVVMPDEDWLLLPCFVTNTADSGPGSLREAIHCANAAALPGQAAVSFRIPPTDPNYVDVDSTLAGGDPDSDAFVIAPVSELPEVRNAHGWGIYVDGRTQTRFGGDTNPFGPEIMIVNRPTTEPAVANGLTLSGRRNRLFGLNIQGFAEYGIRIYGSRNWVAGNFIGTDATGRFARGNNIGVVCVLLGSNENLIGTNGDGVRDELERNVISGNGLGVALWHGNRHVVAGNYIGTDATGQADLGNDRAGVYIAEGSNENRIGTNGDGLSDDLERNLISGNDRVGIQIIQASSNVVAGNFIGTDVTGRVALGNRERGIHMLHTWRTRIGTNGDGLADEAERNVIAGNGLDGILIDFNSGENWVAGNYIGTDLSGTAALPNGANGVYIFDPSTSAFASARNIVGTNQDGRGDVAERNLISGNTLHGVFIEGAHTANNVVAGNYIGTDATGTLALKNEGDGIRIENSAGNRIGGPNAARNVVSGNQLNGVVISGASATDNAVIGNYIGTDASGTVALSNLVHGVLIAEGAQFNVVGTNGDGSIDEAERNVVAGNGRDGVRIERAPWNAVAGNHIGTNADGTSALGNGAFGVIILNGAHFNRVGTNGDGLADATERNLISGNGTRGVSIALGSDHNVVAGNYIGTDVTGLTPLSNGSGVFIGSGSQWNILGTNGDGQADAAERNVIGGNIHEGVIISTTFGRTTSGNVVAGNYIGVDVTGSDRLGNGGHGVAILFGAQLNRVGTNADGLADAAERNIISANSLHGVYIEGAGTDRNIVAGNYVGTDWTGTLGLGNGGDGVRIIEFAAGNLVGGTTSAARNIISSNGNEGIRIQNAATSNLVQGNFIGTDVSGSKPLSNASDGVAIVEAHANVVGGSAPGAGNLISANILAGVVIQGSAATGNSVQGNLIGTDATGTLRLGNYGHGVVINVASNNLIGGKSAGAANVISSNRAGVFIGSDVLAGISSGNHVRGNLIGTDITGLNPLPNGANGVEIVNRARDNVVGTDGDGLDDRAERNLISANGTNGVEIRGADATGNIVAGNWIGFKADGEGFLPNGMHGVYIQNGANGNRIGTDGFDTKLDVDEGNRIAGNLGDGVRVIGAGTVKNSIRGNSIYSNELLGIDLAGDGVTPNDERDTDKGPNELQNYPELSTATPERGGTRVRGELRSLPRTNFRLDFYASAEPDPSGFGEGQRWIGSFVVTTNGSGLKRFNEILPEATMPDEFVSATATEEPAGNTSEFSEVIQVDAGKGKKDARSRVASLGEERFSRQSQNQPRKSRLSGAEERRSSSLPRNRMVVFANVEDRSGTNALAAHDAALALETGALALAVATSSRLVDVLSDEELLELNS